MTSYQDLKDKPISARNLWTLPISIDISRLMKIKNLIG